MYYGIEEDMGGLSGEPPAQATGWNAVAQQVGNTAQNVMQQYMDLQAAKHGLKTQPSDGSDTSKTLPFSFTSQQKKTNWTPWVIGGVGLALVGGYVLFTRRKANNPGKTGWKTIGG